MHCFASENQTYTGTWLFGVESWKSLKGQENLLLKNLQVKTRVENVRFLSWRIFFVGKYGIQSTNEMAFKRTVTLRASFRFPAIRFDAPTLLSFSGCTHAHTKCSPVSIDVSGKDRGKWICSIRSDSAEHSVFSFMYSNTQFRTKKSLFRMKKEASSFLV